MDYLRSNDLVSVPPNGGLVSIFSKDGEAKGAFFLAGGMHTATAIWARMSPGQLIELDPEMHVVTRRATIRANKSDQQFASGANQTFRPDTDPVAKKLEAKLRSVSTLERRLQKQAKLLERSLATQPETLRAQAAAMLAEQQQQAAERAEQQQQEQAAQ